MMFSDLFRKKCNSLCCYTYNRKYIMTILKSMRIIRSTLLRTLLFFISTAVFCWSCEVEQDDGSNIIVTNVFTPVGEGDNCVLEVKSSNNGEVVSLKIYTRAGVLVFSIEAPLCRWDGCSLDGRPMANGVYFYSAEIRGTKIKKSGSVHLYR